MNFRCVLVCLALFVPSLAIAEEAPPTLEQRCTSDEASSYRGEGATLKYVFELQNKCEKRLRCDLHISIVNAFGIKLGHKVLVLAPKSQGSLVLKIKGAGGLNQHTHRCKEI